MGGRCRALLVLAATAAALPGAPALFSTMALASTSAPAPGAQRLGSAPSGGAAVPCAGRAGPYGRVQVCPPAAPVGGHVTLFVTGCKGATFAFLGPLAYIGSGGGGAELPVLRARYEHTYHVSFVVPSEYATGGRVNVPVPVVAGQSYQIVAYPAGICSVPFTVTSPRGTRTAVYDPFTAGGRIKPSLRVVARSSGKCFASVGAVDDRNYYRCFGATTGILDPCFAGPRRTSYLPATLVCPGDPRSLEVVVFEAKPVVPPPAVPKGYMEPWEIELSTGEACRFVAAAWGGLGPYDCQLKAFSGAGAMADCHLPKPTAPSWTAQCQAAKSTSSPFKPEVVKEVWF